MNEVGVEVNAAHLTALLAELGLFVDPCNPQGFVRHFYIWVVKRWGEQAFYDTQIVDTGYDVSTQPHSTGEPLSLKARIYREFINANNGNTIATYYSGSGLACDTLETDLQEYFGNICAKKINDYIKKHQLLLAPSDRSDFADTVAEAIWQESFNDDDLNHLAADIICGYSCLGTALEPYLCPLNGPDEYENNAFCQWTLADFKNALVVRTDI